MNLLMDELSKTLKESVNKNIIFYKYRFPNMPATSNFIGDFVVVLNSGYTIYIECKKTESNNVVGINNENKKHQVMFNQYLKDKEHSKHVYVFGYYKFNKKGLRKFKYYSNYYLIKDITPFLNKKSISESFLRDNYVFGVSLEDIVRHLTKMG